MNPYPQYPQINPYMTPTYPQPKINNGINWVQGIEGAKAYQLSPNSQTILLDSEQNRMFIKISDNIGMCSLRVFDINEITGNPTQNTVIPQPDMSQYVTKQELAETLKDYIGGGKNESVSTVESSAGKKSK